MPKIKEGNNNLGKSQKGSVTGTLYNIPCLHFESCHIDTFLMWLLTVTIRHGKTVLRRYILL